MGVLSVDITKHLSAICWVLSFWTWDTMRTAPIFGFQGAVRDVRDSQAMKCSRYPLRRSSWGKKSSSGDRWRYPCAECNS